MVRRFLRQWLSMREGTEPAAPAKGRDGWAICTSRRLKPGLHTRQRAAFCLSWPRVLTATCAAWTVLLAGGFLFSVLSVAAADGEKPKKHAAPAKKGEKLKVDVSKLPPPATNKVVFAKDIQPILKNSCLDCHDADGPMGDFRLDKRAFALKGGESGVDILPGKSAESPLVHYVAGLVKDMEMPPKDQGDPLTKSQISLLRAWIDQGAKWE